MKKNIILLHGWGADVTKFFPLKKYLVSLGWKVYVPKIPGFDENPPYSVWTLNDYASDIASKSSKFFGGKYFIFGHSFGGRVAMKMATAESENISGIILCSTGGLSRGFFPKRLLFFLLAKIGKIFMIFPPFANVFRNLLYKAARERDYFKTEGVMKETFKNVVREDLKKDVYKIHKPTLILWGKNDRLTPIKDAYFLLKNIKKGLSTYVFYEGQGHGLPYEKPKELALEIEKWYKSTI